MNSLSRVRPFATPWTVAHQAPPSMGFSGQEHWSGVPLPSPTKWAEDPNRHFSKEDTDGQQAHEKMLNIRERPILYVVTYVQNLKNKQMNIIKQKHTVMGGGASGMGN